MKTLKATCDRILAIVPQKSNESELIGGIIVPKHMRDRLESTGLCELEIAAAGPDCKVASAGMRVVVSKAAAGEPFGYGDAQYVCFSEVTALFIVAEEADIKTPPTASIAPVRPTIAEVRAAVGSETAPKDDSSDLPPQKAAD